MPEAQTRRLAAIMFTDMVGYSALMHKNEALAFELLEEQRSLLRPVFSKHGGREIKTIADGFLVEFVSALEAVRCALDIQATLAERNVSAPRERQIRVRIGLHVGDIIYQENDVYGDGVNIASRLEPLAEPGGICLSEDVARQIHHKIEASLLKLGPGELKNISDEVVVYKIDPSAKKRSGALWKRLAFLIRRRRGRAFLIALVAIFILAVSYVWQVATRKSRLPSTVVAMKHKPNPEVVRLYREGIDLWNERTLKGLTQAMERFEEAVEKDRDYAPPAAMLACCYIVLADHGYSTPRDSFRKALSYADLARSKQPDIAIAHAAFACAKWFYDRDWQVAKDEFQYAIDHGAEDPEAYQWRSLYWIARGQKQKSIEDIQRAQEIAPGRLMLKTAAGFPYFYAREYEAGIKEFQKALDTGTTGSRFNVAHLWLARAYEQIAISRKQKAKFKKAIDEFQTAVRDSNRTPMTLASLAHAYAVSGRRGEAAQILRELQQRMKENRYVSPVAFAKIYAGLDDKKRAMDWLREADKERCSDMLFLKVDPIYDKLRAEPKFLDLVSEIRFPQ